VALGLLDEHLAAALLDYEERVALVALVDDHRAFRRETRVQLARQRAEEIVGEGEENRHPLKHRKAATELVRCRIAAAR
jgi:DNA-binding NarL/FixJ family response regulator